MRRYIIIGSGVAGLAAAEAIRSQDSFGSILMICNDPHGYYSRPGLAFMLTREIPKKSAPLNEKEFIQLKVTRVLAQVNHISPEHSSIRLQGGKILPYDRLLIATGAEAIIPNYPGKDLSGVLKLDDLEDIHQIIKQAKKGRTCVVVGGGITALELVEGFVERGLKIHYLLRGDRYWKNILDASESKIIETRLRHHGVMIHYQAELAEILGKNGRVSGIKTVDGHQLACDLVGIAVGNRPRKQLADPAGLKVDKGILVNEYLQTCVPNIYAAGDVAQVYDPFSKKYVLDSLWGPAREQGFAAGLNMAGKTAIYHKPIAFNITRLAGLTTTIIGMVGGEEKDGDLMEIARGESETWREFPDAIAAQSGFDVNRLRVMVGENTILGAILIGDQTLSKPLRDMVLNQVDITPIRSMLLTANAPIADILADFWIMREEEQHASVPV